MSKTTMRKGRFRLDHQGMLIYFLMVRIAGKQDDKNSTAMREIQSQQPANKKCFDCEQRGPTYVNMTIGSFVCTKCSGLLRGSDHVQHSQIFLIMLNVPGINPPHRIKSISMSTFSNEEVEMMRSKGRRDLSVIQY